MLQQMRSMKMVVFWFVAITFLIGFVFFGGLSSGRLRGGASSSNNVAEVNGAKIPYETYNRYVTQLAEAERARFQRDELLSQDYDRIEGQAWEGLINEMLVSQQAQKLGISVPDDEIVNILSQNPPDFIRQRFTDDKGQFDVAAYQRAVNDPSYNWANDEQYLRSVLPSLKLQQMVRAQASVSEDEVRAEFARRNQRTKVRYVGVRWADIELGAFSPSDADLKSFYEKNPDRFMRGETVVLDVIRIDKKPSPTDEEDAMADAKQVLNDEKRGQSFAQLAESNSEDAATNQRGGDLGWRTTAQLPPEVAAVASKLEAGQTSDPVKVDRGIVLVHTDSVRTGPTGREMRLRQIVLQLKPSAETLDSLRARVTKVDQEAKKEFAATAKKTGLTVQRLEPIERLSMIPDIGFSKRLTDWAFEAKPGDVSDPVSTETAVFIARLVEKRDKSTRPFDAAPVRNAMQEQMKKERAHQRLEKLPARVQAGASLDAAAKAEGLEIQDPAPFNYYESVPAVGSANEFSAAASSLEPGKTSGIVETANGDYVLQVVSRDPLDEAAYQKSRPDLYQNLLARRESEIYEAWLKDLRDHADIKDHRVPRV